MGRPRNPVPKMIRTEDGRARVFLPDASRANGRRGVTLGRYGSPEAAAAYRRLLDDLAAGRPPAPVAGLLVKEVVVRFIMHAAGYYLDPATGRPTSELAHFRLAVGELVASAGDDPAAGFGPVALARVRDAFVRRGWGRPYVNAQVRRVRQVFRWAAEHELCPAAVWQALKTVRGLARGRSAAPEPGPVEPAPADGVEAVLKAIGPKYAAMIRAQLLTGCRPQDACRLRGDALDRSGDVWVFRPAEHKTAWRGRTREVWVGPRCQRVLAPWLLKAGDGWLFPGNGPNGETTTGGYDQMVRKCCDRIGVPRWSPGQLRHSTLTEVRRLMGLEAAQVFGGHARADVTQLYAERSADLAAEVARRVG